MAEPNGAVLAMLDTYKVDLPHARQVADLALALYDAAAVRYGLPARARGLLEVGALLHNVGMTTDPPEHHLVGRDIVFRHALDGLSLRDQAIVACMVAFHRKKVRPQLEPAYLGLGKKSRRLALQLAAILRVADGLDYSQSQSTRLLAAEQTEAGLLLRLDGPHAAGDGERAAAKADLWAKVFGEPLGVAAPDDAPAGAGPGDAGAGGDPGDEASPLAPWYSAPDAPLAELGRVLLRRHLRRMLAAERGVRSDRDIEDVHALRVASRRLRASLRLLAPVAPAARLRPMQKAIRGLAQAAGAVRDRDVLLAHMAASRDALPAALQAGLDELTGAVAAERGAARARLIERFDSAGHAAFTSAFAGLMNASAGWDEAPRVRDLAGSTIWRQYEALRAHDRDGIPLEGDEMHALRIDAKKLRYVLELFADTFGERAAPAVSQLAALQDELGTLNDIEVAQEIIAAAELSPPARTAADAYLALRAEQRAETLRAIPARWEKLAGATYRRKLMELIVRL